MEFHFPVQIAASSAILLPHSTGRSLERLLTKPCSFFAEQPCGRVYRVRGEVLYRNPNGLFLGPTFDLIGRRYADFSNTYRLGSYGLLGFRGGFSAGKWEVFGELRNTLDKEYVATLSVLNQAAADSTILNPGTPRAAYRCSKYVSGSRNSYIGSTCCICMTHAARKSLLPPRWALLQSSSSPVRWIGAASDR